jgi:hypothetical protein
MEKIYKIGIGETETSKIYKTGEAAELAAIKLMRKQVANGEEFKLVTIIEYAVEESIRYTAPTKTKRESYREKVLANKEHRAAAKEQKEVEKWRKADERLKAKLARQEKKEAKLAEREYKAAVREQKQIAKWEKSNEIYHTRMAKRTWKEIGEIKKWQKYDRAYKKSHKTTV